MYIDNQVLTYNARNEYRTLWRFVEGFGGKTITNNRKQ